MNNRDLAAFLILEDLDEYFPMKPSGKFTPETIPWLSSDKDAWIECLTGDTKISLLNGTEVAVKYLVGLPEFWVYSCTPEGRIVPGRGHSARVSKKTEKLIEVTLDNGESVKCTPNHPFMLRDGSYKEAEKLVVGDSLMPLYTRVSGDAVGDNLVGYKMVKQLDTDEWHYVHRLVIEECLGGYQKYAQELGTNRLIGHHKDYCKLNNDPRNLEVLTDLQHSRSHGELTSRNNSVRWRSPEYKKRVGSRISASLRSLDDQTKKFIRDSASSGLVDKWATDPEFREKMSGVTRSNMVAYNQSAAHRESVKRLNQTSVVCRECGVSFGNIGALARHSVKHSLVLNHKVSSVKVVNETVDVYDITVDKYNNFALSIGVFTHNTKYDGFNGLLVPEETGPIMYSSSGKPLRGNFSAIISQLKPYLDKGMVFNGEIFGLRDDGTIDWGSSASAATGSGFPPERVVYVVFDGAYLSELVPDSIGTLVSTKNMHDRRVDLVRIMRDLRPKNVKLSKRYKVKSKEDLISLANKLKLKGEEGIIQKSPSAKFTMSKKGTTFQQISKFKFQYKRPFKIVGYEKMISSDPSKQDLIGAVKVDVPGYGEFRVAGMDFPSKRKMFKMGDELIGKIALVSWLGRPAITRADIIVPRAPANLEGIFSDTDLKNRVV